jgi:hypothetical protein
MSGHLTTDLATVVLADPVGTERTVKQLLDEFFPRTV